MIARREAPDFADLSRNVDFQRLAALHFLAAGLKNFTPGPNSSNGLAAAGSRLRREPGAVDRAQAELGCPGGTASASRDADMRGEVGPGLAPSGST